MPTISYEALQQLLSSPNIQIPNSQISTYFTDLFLYLWTTIHRGYFFDSQPLFHELHLLISHQQPHISNRILLELCLLECQFWIKRKKKDRLVTTREKLMKDIEDMEEQEAGEIVSRYNSLVVFDQGIELILPCESEIIDVVKMSDRGDVAGGIRLLTKLITENKYPELEMILNILLGKLYLLKPDIQALSIFNKIAKSTHMIYQSYLAKLLFIAGYKSLQKLNINPQSFSNQYIQYQQYIQKYNNDKINIQIQTLQKIFKSISKADLPSEKLQHIERALKKVGELPCYSKPSIIELDLYLFTVTAKYHENKLGEGKKWVEKAREVAKKMGICSGSKESKIGYKLALICEKEKKYEEAIKLVEKAIKKQWKEKELRVLYEMRDRLDRRIGDQGSEMIYEEEEEQEEEEVVGSRRQHEKRNNYQKEQQNHQGPVVHSQNTLPNDDQQQEQNIKPSKQRNQQKVPEVEIPQPNKNAINCCLLF